MGPDLLSRVQCNCASAQRVAVVHRGAQAFLHGLRLPVYREFISMRTRS